MRGSGATSVSGLGLFVMIAWLGCHRQLRDQPAHQGASAPVAAADHEPTRNEPAHNEPAQNKPTRNKPAHDDPAPGEPAHDSVDAHRLELVARAEKSLAQSWPLDYHRPFSDRAGERPATSALYLEACRAGDKPSCRIAAVLEGEEPGPASTLVVANCRAGDLPSCWSIPDDSPSSKKLPGAAGRSSCNLEGGPCDTEALRFECLAGFAHSCYLCGQRSQHEMPDREALAARTAEAARAACRDRRGADCRLASGPMSDAESEIVLEPLCPLEVISCRTLSAIYLRAGAIERARDLAERTCQYGGNHNRYDCFYLGEYYRDGTFPEPVPGRGEALVAWVCSDSEGPMDPMCREWLTKHPSRDRARQ